MKEFQIGRGMGKSNLEFLWEKGDNVVFRKEAGADQCEVRMAGNMSHVKEHVKTLNIIISNEMENVSHCSFVNVTLFLHFTILK